MMRIPFVDLPAQYETLADEINAAVTGVMKRCDFILGKDASLFEAEFAEYCGAKHCVGVDSGTSALELALRAYGIGPGDEVITTANTFVATAFAASVLGATPVLVDIDPQTYNMDPAKLAAAVTERTKAVIPVHLYGCPADMTPILDVARRHHLIVIEDACQAHGATYHGARTGTLGHAAAFSFYPGKNLGAYGDGGAVVTDDAEIARFIRVCRDQGQSEKYHHVMVGHNHRLDTLQAAILRVKLPHLDDWNDARRRNAAIYDEFFADNPNVVTPSYPEGFQSAYHLYVIRVKNRDAVRKHLDEQGIACGIHYPIPIHLQPAYQHLGYMRGAFPITEAYADDILSLPMYAELTEEAIQHVVQEVGLAIERTSGKGMAVSVKNAMNQQVT